MDIIGLVIYFASALSRIHGFVPKEVLNLFCDFFQKYEEKNEQMTVFHVMKALHNHFPGVSKEIMRFFEYLVVYKCLSFEKLPNSFDEDDLPLFDEVEEFLKSRGSNTLQEKPLKDGAKGGVEYKQRILQKVLYMLFVLDLPKLYQTKFRLGKVEKIARHLLSFALQEMYSGQTGGRATDIIVHVIAMVQCVYGHKKHTRKSKPKLLCAGGGGGEGEGEGKGEGGGEITSHVDRKRSREVDVEVDVEDEDENHVFPSEAPLPKHRRDKAVNPSPIQFAEEIILSDKNGEVVDITII